MLTTSQLIDVALPVGGAYAVNDYVGPGVVGGVSGIPIPNAALHPGDGGTIQSLVLYDFAHQMQPLDVFFFSNPGWGAPNDNAPWLLGNLGAPYCLGMASISTYTDFSSTPPVAPTVGAMGFALFPSGPITYRTEPSGALLYLALVTRGTPTYPTTPNVLRLRVGLFLD